MTTSLPPVFTVIAGSNGAGKSTLTASLRTLAGTPVLDPDALARRMRPDAPDRAATRAARESIALRRRYVEEGRSFAVETTLAGMAILRHMADARRHGYSIHLIYIGLDDVQIALDRITVRVARGGHSVPERDVRRRYARSLSHLPKATELADRVTLIDNTSDQGPREVLALDHGQITMRAIDPPRWVGAALGEAAG